MRSAGSSCRRSLLDTISQYCDTRRELEQQGWMVVSRLAVESARLMDLAGVDSRAFAVTKAKCGQLKVDLMGLRKQLGIHRAQHGC